MLLNTSSCHEHPMIFVHWNIHLHGCRVQSPDFFAHVFFVTGSVGQTWSFLKKVLLLLLSSFCCNLLNPPTFGGCVFVSYVLFKKRRSSKDLTQRMRIEVSSPSAPNWPFGLDSRGLDSRCSFGLLSWCGALHWKNGGRWQTFPRRFHVGKMWGNPMGCWSIRFPPLMFFGGDIPKLPS